jgi:hypothetical protein
VGSITGGEAHAIGSQNLGRVIERIREDGLTQSRKVAKGRRGELKIGQIREIGLTQSRKGKARRIED